MLTWGMILSIQYPHITHYPYDTAVVSITVCTYAAGQLYIMYQEGHGIAISCHCPHAPSTCSHIIFSLLAIM